MQPWWRHQVGLFSAVLALCAGNSPVPVNSPHKGQWRGALVFSLICAWINDWVNNRQAGDFRRHRGHYYVIVMIFVCIVLNGSHNVLIKHSRKFVFTSPIESKLTCVQVISHYLNRGWRSSLTYICGIRLQLFNIAVICSWWRHQMETFSVRSPVNYLRKGQRCGAWMFSLICTWINGWINNREAVDLGRHRAHYNVTVMVC